MRTRLYYSVLSQGIVRSAKPSIRLSEVLSPMQAAVRAGRTLALLPLLQFQSVKSRVIWRSVPAGGNLSSKGWAPGAESTGHLPIINSSTFQLDRKRELQVHVFNISPEITSSPIRYHN